MLKYVCQLCSVSIAPLCITICSVTSQKSLDSFFSIGFWFTTFIEAYCWFPEEKARCSTARCNWNRKRLDAALYIAALTCSTARELYISASHNFSEWEPAGITLNTLGSIAVSRDVSMDICIMLLHCRGVQRSGDTRGNYLIAWRPGKLYYWGCLEYRRSKTTSSDLCHVQKDHATPQKFALLRNRFRVFSPANYRTWRRECFNSSERCSFWLFFKFFKKLFKEPDSDP